jgi:hypothetical protein
MKRKNQVEIKLDAFEANELKLRNQEMADSLNIQTF